MGGDSVARDQGERRHLSRQWMASKTPIKLGGAAPAWRPGCERRGSQGRPGSAGPASSPAQGDGRDRWPGPSGEVAGLLVPGVDAATWRSLDSGEAVAVLQTGANVSRSCQSSRWLKASRRPTRLDRLIKVGIQNPAAFARPWPFAGAEESRSILRRAFQETLRDSLPGRSREGQADRIRPRPRSSNGWWPRPSALDPRSSRSSKTRN